MWNSASYTDEPAPDLHASSNVHLQDVVKALLDGNIPADTEVRSSPSTLSSGASGFTALSYACSGSMYEVGTLAVAQLLLQRKADVNKTAADGTTPLMFAAFAHGGEMVKLLLAAGADAQAKGGRALRTPLMIAAARRGDRGLSVAEALIQEAGMQQVADLCMAMDEEGRTAYDHALASGSSAVAQLLEQYSSKAGAVLRTYTGSAAGIASSGSILQHQLRQAAAEGKVEECKRVIEELKGSSRSPDSSWTPDKAVDGSGRTPLHLAVLSASEDRYDVAQLLLKERCDANRM